MVRMLTTNASFNWRGNTVPFLTKSFHESKRQLVNRLQQNKHGNQHI